MLGTPDTRVHRPSGEPGPVEADEDAWRQERERRNGQP
jgi:hypothetical protein